MIRCKGNGSYFYQVEPHGVSCSSEQISPRWSEPRTQLGRKRSLSPCSLAKNKTCLLSDPSYFFGLKISAASKAASVSWALDIRSEKSSERASEIELGERFWLPVSVLHSPGVSSCSCSQMHLPKDSLEMCSVLSRHV